MQQNDPLSGFYADEQQQEQDPLAGFYDDEQGTERDIAAHLSKPSDAQSSKQNWWAQKAQGLLNDRINMDLGVLSGLTLGATEHIPALKPEAGTAATIGELAGSFVPIEGLYTVFGKPLMRAAAKSPIFQRQLSSLARITGMGLTGASYKAGKDIVKGETPSFDDLLEHGAEWAVIDAGLQLLGKTGAFISGAIKKAGGKGEEPWKLTNRIVKQMKSEGIEFDGSTPDKTAKRALEILEREPEVAQGQIKPTAQEPDRIAELAQRELEETQQATTQLKDRKINNRFFDRVDPDAPWLKEVDFPDAVETDTLLRDIEKVATESRALEEFPEIAATDKEFGQEVKGFVDEFQERAAKEYNPKYKIAQEEMGTATSEAQNTSNLAINILQDVNRLRTQPGGFKTVAKHLETLLEDLGFVIEKNADGSISNIQRGEKAISVADLSELGKRLNEVINYDLVEKNVINRLEPVVQALKRDIRQGLAGNKSALTAYELAEQKFAETAEIMGKKNIKAIRFSPEPENIPAIIAKPTTLNQLRKVVTPEQLEQIERKILESIGESSISKAQKDLRNLEPFLSDKARKAGRSIVKSKVEATAKVSKSQALKDEVRDSLYKEFGKASITGETPEKALKLWQTSKGKGYINDALKGTPNDQAITKYLNRKVFHDKVSSFIGENGIVNFSKLDTLLDDKKFIEAIEAVTGKDGINELRKIQGQANKLKIAMKAMEGSQFSAKSEFGKSILQRAARKQQALTPESRLGQKALEGIPSPKAKFPRGKAKLEKIARRELPLKFVFEDFEASLGLSGKTFLSGLGIVGIPVLGASSIVGKYAMYKMLKHVLSNRNVQSRLSNAVRAAKHAKGPNPTPFWASIEALDKALEEAERQDHLSE